MKFVEKTWFTPLFKSRKKNIMEFYKILYIQKPIYKFVETICKIKN